MKMYMLFVYAFENAFSANFWDKPVSQLRKKAASKEILSSRTTLTNAW
jgi:hypothetical protein